MSKPDNKSPQYARMETHWALPDALLEGTRAMRGGFTPQMNAGLAAKTHTVGTAWLPAHPGESVMRYQMRSRMTFLRNFYKKTLKQLVGKLLQAGVTVGDDVPPQLAEYLDDVDLCGNSLDTFATEVVEKAIHRGGVFLLADAQDVEVSNLADQKTAGVRPYLVCYDVKDVFGVRFEIINGKEVITQARVYRCSTEPKDDFEDDEVEEILVYTPETIRPFRKVGGSWVEQEERANKLGFVPLVGIGINPVAPFEYRPALSSLAEMNLEHFQIISDYKSALAGCNFAMYGASGYDPEKDPEIVIGPYTMLATTDPQGKYYVIEAQGHGVALSEKALGVLEDQMQQYGLQYLAEKSDTATGRAIDADEATSELAEWGRRIADGLTNALYFMALRMGLKEGGKVTIEPPEPVRQAVVQEAEILLKSRMAGDITRKEYRVEIKRLGVAGEDFDPDAEVDEGDDLGMIPGSTEPTQADKADAELIQMAKQALGNAGG